MSTQPPEQPSIDDRLERYLDGLMSAEDAARFEAEIAANSVLQGQVAAHRRMCGALMGYAAAPGAATLDEAPRPIALATAHRRTPMQWVKFAAIAASIALPVAVAVWYFAPRPQPAEFRPLTSQQYQQKNRELILREYRAQVASGFKPKEVCTTDEAFVAWTTKALGHGLRPSHGVAVPGRSEPVLAGWSRGDIFSSYTGLLLASVDGQPVMVVMDKAPPERMVPAEDASGTPRLFRRKVNGVWLIEVTPLAEARVITGIEAAAP
ncbi:MAG: hypothetical protein Q8L55_05175 [Phycisphaerales bacterium]|nr:hypothetical protein [Phycisphaerales bacterium]